MNLTQPTSRLTTGQRVTAVVVLAAVLITVVWALVATSTPKTQDCYDWATQAGESESNATFVCHWAWNDGYDTSDLTEEEFNTTWSLTSRNIEKLTDSISDYLERN